MPQVHLIIMHPDCLLAYIVKVTSISWNSFFFFVGIHHHSQHNLNDEKTKLLGDINSACGLLASRVSFFKPSILGTCKLPEIPTSDFISSVLTEMKERYLKNGK